ncbi:hypothetical protein MKEN_00628500 [Mycena kentingensis (nom. inval.)]|nr:hypothetical protein MKEN_00628500 [Mycena kentingensis (nom. inval.)]
MQLALASVAAFIGAVVASGYEGNVYHYTGDHASQITNCLAASGSSSHGYGYYVPHSSYAPTQVPNLGIRCIAPRHGLALVSVAAFIGAVVASGYEGNIYHYTGDHASQITNCPAASGSSTHGCGYYVPHSSYAPTQCGEARRITLFDPSTGLLSLTFPGYIQGYYAPAQSTSGAQPGNGIDIIVVNVDAKLNILSIGQPYKSTAYPSH